MTSSIATRLADIKASIQKFEHRYGREPGNTRLLAVSKTKSVESITEAIAYGQREFGESYVQEAVKKISTISNRELKWHFIGPIQKNKTKQIAENFDWVHSVDRLIIAERLNKQRPPYLPPLEVCIQVNIDNESTKSGVPLAEVQDLATSIMKLSQIKLRGLMAIPQLSSDIKVQRQRFRQLRSQLVKLNDLGLNLDTLSMGMTADLEAAIAEGATIVRIGTAIFGKRST